MIRLDPAQLRRIAAASIGAALLSATCVGAAVAPAGAAEAVTPCAPLSIVGWQAEVGRQLDARLAVPVAHLAGRDHLLAAVDVSFDSEGRFTAATVSQGSGSPAVDAQVLRIAAAIDYPSLPGAYRGRPQTVTMQAWFAATDPAAASAPVRPFAHG